MTTAVQHRQDGGAPRPAESPLYLAAEDILWIVDAAFPASLVSHPLFSYHRQEDEILLDLALEHLQVVFTRGNAAGISKHLEVRQRYTERRFQTINYVTSVVTAVRNEDPWPITHTLPHVAIREGAWLPPRTSLMQNPKASSSSAS